MTARPDDAPRRRPGWAAGRVPITTPPTGPWQRPGAGRTAAGGTTGWDPAARDVVSGSVERAAGSGSAVAGGTGWDSVVWGAGSGSGSAAAGTGSGRVTAGGAAPGPAPAATVRELVTDAGRWAVSLAVSGVEDGIAALAARKDPVRKHARRVRRERRRLGAESAIAGGLGVLAATAGVAPGWSVAEIGFGGTAAVVGLAAVGSARRLRHLRRNPPRPGALPRPKRPPRDCPARGPLDRLAERERALTALLDHLGGAGDEPREVAADAAAALRELGTRTTAVDRARRGAAPGSAAGLDAAVAVLAHQLEAGVAAYDALVVAAADAVAASATLRAGDPVLLLRLTEATDSLAGLAQGLHEVSR